MTLHVGIFIGSDEMWSGMNSKHTRSQGMQHTRHIRVSFGIPPIFFREIALYSKSIIIVQFLFHLICVYGYVELAMESGEPEEILFVWVNG